MTRPAHTPRNGRAAVLWAVALLLLVGCSDSGAVTGPVTPESGSPSTAPAIESFTADPASISEGDESELSWVVDDPNAKVKITPGSGSVEGSSIKVSPVVSTTYTLTATNAFGSTRTSVTVTVAPFGSPPAGTGADSTDGTGTSTDSTGETGDDHYAPAWVDAAGVLEGLPSDCQNLSFITSNPYQDMTIAGVNLQGIWSITNGSDTWERMGQGSGSDPITNRLSSIVFDPVDPNVFWESGTYNGGGVYKTVDNGVTFTQLGDVVHSDMVAVDFNDPLRQTLLTGRHEGANLYRSTDGGSTWSDITAGLPSNAGFASAPLVFDSQTYLVGTQDGSNSGVFRTTDGGMTWTTAFTEGVKGAPVVTPSDGAIFWLLKGGEGMITSTDGGITWTEVAGGGPRSILSQSLILMPNERIAAVGGSNIVVTDDKGETWQRVGPRFPYEPNGFAYSPFRDAFFAWRFDCSFDVPNPVRADSIIRLDPLDAGQ